MLAWLGTCMGLGTVAHAQAVASLESDFSRSSLLIDSAAAGMCYHFETYMARSDGQRARGLMHVPELPRFTAMIFWFPPRQQPAMWMRNTLIPLDMLFIEPAGEIAHIAAMTEPYSLATVASPRPARWVLEINGGLAAMLGIDAGDQVLHAWFSDVWPEALNLAR